MNKLVVTALIILFMVSGCTSKVFDPEVTQKTTVLRQNENYDPLSLIDYDKSAYSAEVEENTINTSIAKDYSVTYIIRDLKNDKKSVTRTFKFSVADSVAPVLTRRSDTISISQGTIFHISDYFQAIDEREGNLTEKITYHGELNSFVAGEYEITVSVKDSYDNEASESIKVVVSASDSSSYVRHIAGDYTDISYQSGQAPTLQIRSDGTYTLYINNCTLVNSVQGEYLITDDLLYLTSEQHAFNTSDEYNLALLRILSDGTLRFDSDIVVCAPSYGDIFALNP